MHNGGNGVVAAAVLEWAALPPTMVRWACSRAHVGNDVKLIHRRRTSQNLFWNGAPTKIAFVCGGMTTSCCAVLLVGYESLVVMHRMTLYIYHPSVYIFILYIYIYIYTSKQNQ